MTLHVVATAGHVDHGKSAVVRTLTGMEPDRWEEERRRGLTIDLGYAWATLPSGREVGFVDVPGHERFVTNMLAGVGPVRLILFVVAADEGWKPQSEEHLRILDVLGIERAVIALTKSDLAGEGGLGERRSEVEDRVRGSVLETAAVVACSSVTGEGIELLVAALDSMLADAPAPGASGRARLFIDRAFTIRGSGTVVTGTLGGGRLRVDDQVELLPAGTRARVRGLQTHGRPIDVAEPGSRVAVNLTGVATGEAERGDVLTHPGEWRPSPAFEGTLRALPGLELTGRGDFTVHAGAAERHARVRLLGGAGEDTYVRVRPDAPLVLEPGDRFVLRETGRRITVGGGTVLDPAPPARPGRDAVERLTRRRDAPASELPAVVVAERGAVADADLVPLTGVRLSEVAGAERLGAWWVSSAELQRLREAALEHLRDHHAANPLSGDASIDAVRRALGRVDAGLADEVLTRLEAEGRVERAGTRVRLAGHRVDLGAREADARRVEAALAEGWPAPPTGAGLADRELLGALVETGRAVAISAEVYLLPDQAGRAEALARDLAASPEGMTASAFRERLGTSRKFAIPILEWLDARGVTKREGDLRRLRPPASGGPASASPPASQGPSPR